MSDDDKWLLVKRGLYYRPHGYGYTGLREEAGVYTMAEAFPHVGDGVRMTRLDHAPEFSSGCSLETVARYLTEQRNAARSRIEKQRTVLAAARRFAQSHEGRDETAGLLIGMIDGLDQGEG